MNADASKPRWGLFFAIVVGGLIVAGSLAKGDDKSGGEPSGNMLTPTEVACDMLGDGETTEFTYDVLRDVLGDHEYEVADPDLAARLAVNAAVRRGCEP